MHKYKLETADPYEYGQVLEGGAYLEDILFPFTSLDATEWEELADQAIHAAGYRREGPWRQDGCDLVKQC